MTSWRNTAIMSKTAGSSEDKAVRDKHETVYDYRYLRGR